MDTLKITKADLNERNEYAVADSLEFRGSVEVEANLGVVRIRGRAIVVGALSVNAGSSLEVGGSLKVGSSLEVGGSLEVGSSLEVGWSLEVGESLEVGWSLKVGGSLKVGLSITAKWISCEFRIFAGLCDWKIPSPEEMRINAEVRKGIVCFGEVMKPEITTKKKVADA